MKKILTTRLFLLLALKTKLLFKFNYTKTIVRFAFMFLFLFCASCDPESDLVSDSDNNGSVGVFVFPSTFLLNFMTIYPLSVYIDNELKITYNAQPIVSEGYCSNVDFQIKLPKGPHTIAFVTPDGHYLDGSFTINPGSCTSTSISEDSFDGGKTNFGTNNGTLTFIRTSIPFSHTLIYVDENYIGDITDIPYHQICGLGNGIANIAIILPPGNHTYRAVANEYNRVWSGSITITANSCYLRILQ